MLNQTIISMHENYPFGSCQMLQTQNNEVMVRKQINNGNKDELTSKAKHLKKLQVPNSIQIISIFEDVEFIQIYYEYIPVKFQIWMKSMSDFLSDNLLKQLYILTTFLAQNRISTIFNPEQLGLDKNYHFKYFLDLENTFYNEFQKPYTLKQKYYREINLFVKSLHSKKDKKYNNPLFSSLNSLKTQPNQHFNSPIRSLPRTFERTLSFGSIPEDKFTFINRTETTDHEVPQNKEKIKLSALKKEIVFKSFNQKIQKIIQQLEKVKEKRSNGIIKSTEFKNRASLNDISIKKIVDLKKAVKQNQLQLNKEISIGKLVINKETQEEQLKAISKKSSESVKDLNQGNSYFFMAQSKKKSHKSSNPKKTVKAQSSIWT